MDDESNLDETPPTKRMKISPPIHLLPNELLVKVIENLPRTQWPDLELVDKKLRDAVLLAWGSIRNVDMERDFIYFEPATEYENDDDFQADEKRMRHQIAQNTESILKMLSERSPFITSLCGLPLTADDPTVNTMAVRYLAEFEHLETINFAKKYSSGFVNGKEIHLAIDISFIKIIEFLESTRSRATLKEIKIELCSIPYHDDPNFVARLRAAFNNVSNDPTRQLLQLESVSMMRIYGPAPLTLFDTMDATRMTKLSLGLSHIDPTVLTNFINRALHLQHIDFRFYWSCGTYGSPPVCQGGRLETNKNLFTALESRRSLASLEFNRIWDRIENVHGCTCHQFDTEFKKMLRTIGPQLVNFVFKPGFLPVNTNMGEIRDIIQRHMPRLKSIALSDVCAKNPEELRGIADGKKLEEIEIGPFYRNTNDGDYNSILNEVLSTIIIKSPRLQQFSGVGYYYCPDQRVVVELCKLSDLIGLRIGANRLTDENFVAFSQQGFAEKLQVLKLVGIGDGVESGMITLIEKATQLRELVAYGNVTDRLLECVAMSCPNLERFWIRSTDGITFNGVQLLVDRCHKLRWLSVDYKDGTLACSLKNLKLQRYRKLEMELSKFF